MKHLVGILSKDEAVKAHVISVVMADGSSGGYIDLMQPVEEHLPAALGIKSMEQFRGPLQVGDHHVRHFFSKLQMGVRAVQNYSGKILNTAEEAVDYFKSIGAKAFGADWLVGRVVEVFDEQKKPAIYLTTDLTLDDAKRLKSMLGNSFSSVFVGEPDNGVEVDVVLPIEKTKGAQKRITIQMLESIKNAQPTIKGK